MLRRLHKADDDTEQGGARPVQPPYKGGIEGDGGFVVDTPVGRFALSEDDARALKALCDAGGAKGFVGGVSPAILRRLRVAGLVDLLQHPTKGTQATLSTAGMLALPKAMKRIAASGMGR